jgi:hypothetical protein
MRESIRSTVYFDAELHHALRLKSAHTRRSLSELVNDAVRAALNEFWQKYTIRFIDSIA